jgi:hypothetical protein
VREELAVGAGLIQAGAGIGSRLLTSHLLLVNLWPDSWPQSAAALIHQVQSTGRPYEGERLPARSFDAKRGLSHLFCASSVTETISYQAANDFL